MMGFFLFYDWTYMLYIAIPFAILGMWAQGRVKSAFNRGSRIATSSGRTGRQVAEAILHANGIADVSVEPARGFLSDHYDPRHKVLRLSPDVYDGRSVAAAGVAAHEVGHAIQHARGYTPLALRNMVVPTAGLGSGLGMTLAMIGIGFGLNSFALIGCALFTMFVIFQLVNLPVEFNASRRARQTLLANGLVTQQEDAEVGRVLNAAAMTYVAATIQAVVTLLYFLMRAGLLGGSRD
jgi:Zn-dependent membrane protease YugP